MRLMVSMLQDLLPQLMASEAELRESWSARPWWEVADVITASIADTTELCASQTLPIVEVKALWLAQLRAQKIILDLRDEWRSDPAEMRRLHSTWRSIAQELRSKGVESRQEITEITLAMSDWYRVKPLRRLQAAIQAFRDAFYCRNPNSPQAKYAEARLSSRRALMEKHDRLLDGFPTLVAVLRRVCSHEAWAYLVEDVRLTVEEFLDALHILAHDRTAAAMVANPPARVRWALARRQRRQQSMYRQRWMPTEPEQSDALQDPENVESSVIARVDWEHGRRDLHLPPDQTQAVEARMAGLKLQSAEAAHDLCWDPSRLEAVRRSLEPNRRWGQKLRRRFSAYNPEASENEDNKNF
jgi:hypothetical protein